MTTEHFAIHCHCGACENGAAVQPVGNGALVQWQLDGAEGEALLTVPQLADALYMAEFNFFGHTLNFDFGTADNLRVWLAARGVIVPVGV